MTQPVSIRYYYMVNYAYQLSDTMLRIGQAFVDDTEPLNSEDRVKFTEAHLASKYNPPANNLHLTNIYLLRTERNVG